MKKAVLALLALPATLLATGAGYTAVESHRAEGQHPRAGSSITVGDVRLHYVTAGSGPAVVLLHGNPGTADDWRPLMQHGGGGSRYIAFDRPGHGYSERGDAAMMTPARQAGVLHDALVSLGVQKAVIVGHSWGAGLALIYALEFPEAVEGLVLIGPRAFQLPGGESAVYRLTRTPVAGDVFRYALMLPVGRSLTAAGVQKAYAPEPLDSAHLRAARALWLRPGQAQAIVWDTKNLQQALGVAAGRYGTISAPTVVVVGEHDDRMEEAMPLARAIPGAELEVVAGAGHYVNRTRPEIIWRAIARARSGDG